MIDEDFRIWLIEVNTNPYFGIANEYIADLLPKMIDDMTRIVVDPIYPPRNVEDPARENLFELVYSDDQNINKRRPFSMDLVYPVPELKQQVGTTKQRVPKVSYYLKLFELMSIERLTKSSKIHTRIDSKHINCKYKLKLAK